MKRLMGLAAPVRRMSPVLTVQRQRNGGGPHRLPRLGHVCSRMTTREGGRGLKLHSPRGLQRRRDPQELLLEHVLALEQGVGIQLGHVV